MNTRGIRRAVEPDEFGIASWTIGSTSARTSRGPAQQVADDGARIADRVEHDEIAGQLAVIVGELRRHPAPEAVAEHDHRVGDADRRDELGDPVGVVGEGPSPGRQGRGATEARQRRVR